MKYKYFFNKIKTFILLKFSLQFYYYNKKIEAIF